LILSPTNVAEIGAVRGAVFCRIVLVDDHWPVRQSTKSVIECSAGTEKENYMSSNQDNRVLGRIGARELSPEEIEQVTGAAGRVHTNNCTALTATNTGDGDACLDHDVY
jgi:hypothetical protein